MVSSCLRAALLGLALIHSTAWAAATLENPAPGSLKSGVGVVSGWVCDAEELEVSFDGGARLFVPYGSERVDTTGVCGDTDNGFGLLWNYNELGDGPHTVALYADDILQTQVNFNVVTLGANFLRGVTGQGTIALSDGKQVNVQWEETTQGFTITGYSEGGGTGGPSTADSEFLLNRMRGTWRFYYDSEQHYLSPPADEDNYDVWVFSDIEIWEGVPVLVGDYTTLDHVEWVIVALANEFPLTRGTAWGEEYEYVAFYKDAWPEEYHHISYGYCEFLFFDQFTAHAVRGAALSEALFEDGTCGIINSRPPGGLKATGFRMQGPQ